MDEVAPGRTTSPMSVDCRNAGPSEDPVCTDLHHFLHCPSNAYIDYDYYFCAVCKRIWDKSFFYQDWEPHWTVRTLAEIKLERKRWLGDSGKDAFPDSAFQGGILEFEQWVLSIQEPVLAGSSA